MALSAAAAAAAQADLEQVTKALLDCEAYPPAARQMLLEGLPHSVTTGSDRHEFQAEFAGLARSALLDAQRWATEKQACWAEGEQDAKLRLEERQAALEEAAAGESAARAERDAQAARSEEAAKAAATARAEHEAASKGGSMMQALRQKLLDAKEKAVNVTEGSLRMLVDGGWADEEIKAAASAAVCEALRAVDAEAPLIAAAPAALELKPEERGIFDNVTIESMKEVLAQRVKELDAKLAESADEAKTEWAETLGLWALKEVRQEEALAQTAAKEQAQAALEAAVQTMKAAKKEVAEHKAALSKATTEQTAFSSKAEEVVAALLAMDRLIANKYEQQEQQEKEADDVEMAAGDVEMTAADAEVEAEAPAVPAAQTLVQPLLAPAKEDKLGDMAATAASFDPKQVPTPMLK